MNTCARLVLLIALACPSFVFADSFDFQGSGNLMAGTASVFGRIAVGRTWGVQDELTDVTDVTTGHTTSGMLGTIFVLSGTLMSCSSGFCFTGGSVDIDSTHGQELFAATFTKGTISVGNGITILNGRFTNGAAALIKDSNGDFSTQVLTGRHGAVIPEPSSMILLGSGLLAVVGLRKRIMRNTDIP